MDYIELLFGFDAREMWHYEDVQAMGARTVSGIGFLREGVKKGLSVDPSIWGSVFDTGDCPALVGENRKRAGLGILKLPDWIGSNNPLWENLSELEKFLAKNDSEIIKPYWIIAITRISRHEEIDESSIEWPSFEPTIPPSILPEWRSVGFDITDGGGEAHLTGTEFRGDEQYLESLCNRWGRCLNEYHLFRNLTDAIEYKEFESQREPHHVPYYVYGIWLIKDIKK